MMNRTTSVAYIDLLTVLFALFVMVCGILLSVHISETHGNTTSKAEYIAELTWDEKSNSDVDLWAKNPLGTIVYFKNKDAGFMTLDRDDTGINDNTVIGPDGTRIMAPNRQEVLSIRTIMPGKTVINVMLYALRNPPPIHVKVEIIKLNPFAVVAEKEVDLTVEGQEVTIASFIVNQDGSFSDVDTVTQEMFSQELQR